MGDHFTLDVQPDRVLAAARRLGELVDVVARHGDRVASAPERWQAGWESDSSDAIGGQARDLGRELGRFGTRLDTASRAMKAYGEVLRTAVQDDLADLNRRWRQAESAHATAVQQARRRHETASSGLDPRMPSGARRAEQLDIDGALRTATAAASGELASARDKLEGEFDDLRALLRRRTRSLGATLSAEVAVPVTSVEVAAFTVMGNGGWPGWLKDLFGLDPLATVGSRARRQIGGGLGSLAEDLMDPPDDYDRLRELLARARALGVPPVQYSPTLEKYWQHRAAEAAGIDLSQWDPSKGAAHNREIIEAVYRYYGDLYLANPDLQWAGMANMIGPSFAAGFLDLGLFRDLAGSLADVPAPLKQVVPDGMEAIASWTEEDLRFFESTFLSMQKEIFFDQGTMHQAYVDGGMAAIREMEAAGLMEPDLANGWQGIDSGVPSRVQDANELFLWREQYDIIRNDYIRMFDHTPTGGAMTWLMTQVGAPSIPGAKSFPEVFPLTVSVTTPGPEELGTPRSIFGQPIPHISVDNPLQATVTVQTPFAAGNIAGFEDRWRLIEQDTLPAYQQLLRDDPDRARDLISADVGSRIRDYRLDRRIIDILEQLENWKVDIDQ